MLLYLRYQVEEFAWKKWGSPEGLDAEYERRLSEKKKKKNKKFEQSLRELRRKTKESVWQRKKDEEHKHSFGPSEKDDTGVSLQICQTCGFTLEFEELWDTSCIVFSLPELGSDFRQVRHCYLSCFPWHAVAPAEVES